MKTKELHPVVVRIRRDHYYVLADHPGISGFKDYSRKVECIVTGHKAANNRCLVQREYLASGLGRFECDDGHLPGHRPIVSEVEALRFLDANPFQSIRQMPD